MLTLANGNVLLRYDGLADKILITELATTSEGTTKRYAMPALEFLTALNDGPAALPELTGQDK